MKTFLILAVAAVSLSSCSEKSAAQTPSTAASVEAAASHDFPKGSPKFFTDYKAAMAEAKKENKPAILVFSAAWCGPCQAMKKSVYPSKEVTPLHDKFVWAYLDIDLNANTAPSQKYAVQGIPHIQFVSPGGKELGNQVGSTTAGDFAGTLNKTLAKVAK